MNKEFKFGDLVLTSSNSGPKKGYGVVVQTMNGLHEGVSREGKSMGDTQNGAHWINRCFTLIHRPSPDVSKGLRP